MHIWENNTITQKMGNLNYDSHEIACFLAYAEVKKSY